MLSGGKGILVTVDSTEPWEGFYPVSADGSKTAVDLPQVLNRAMCSLDDYPGSLHQPILARQKSPLSNDPANLCFLGHLPCSITRAFFPSRGCPLCDLKPVDKYPTPIWKIRSNTTWIQPLRRVRFRLTRSARKSATARVRRDCSNSSVALGGCFSESRSCRGH